MKKQLKKGFTLVELLVVISIIGMLAGMLLPAVNAARENGRRATCVNNQSQIALALIAYDNSKGELPPMRGPIYTTTTGTGQSITTIHQYASWIGFILPQMEYNQLYQNLKGGQIGQTGGPVYTTQFIRLPGFICRSAITPSIDATSHYVCNGGYQNAAGVSAWKLTTTTEEFEPAKMADTIFFDNKLPKVDAGASANTPPYLIQAGGWDLKGSIGYIGVNSGTSNTILISENLQGGQWGYWGRDSRGGTNYAADAPGELITYSHDPLYGTTGAPGVAFCYPTNQDMTTAQKISAQARPSKATSNADYSYHGYDDPTTLKDYATPGFINVQREGDTTLQYRMVRPSSFHVACVVAAFADRSVRILNENMKYDIFVNICQPNSGEVVNLKDLN